MSKKDAQMTGRSYRARGEEVPLRDSEYADDTAVIFDNRQDAVVETESLVNHFHRFCTVIHAGVSEPRQSSKTELLFCAKALSLYESREDYDNADLSDIVLSNNRYIPIVHQFAYLGSIITTNGTDDLDVDMRIRKAGNAFGCLRKSIFSSSNVDYSTKGRVYCSFILPILLYGAECWCLTEKLLKLLSKFQNQCVRVMCHTNRYLAWQNRLSMSDLFVKLSLNSIDTYVTKKQLQWAGHVMRMPWERLPRKMLTCWVRSKRPRGCPKFTYGRSIRKLLKKSGIDTSEWYVIASDRPRWRGMINNICLS